MGFIVKENSRIDEKYYYLKHKSGVDIYVVPKPFSTSYAIFGTKYGSIDRTFKAKGDDDFITIPDGVAHFLEHKLFENENGEDTFERYARFGGSANAFTSFEKTAYLFSCTENFNENLKILLEFVQHPYFTEATVQKEQGIIGEEIKMYEDMPSWRVLFNLLGAMYHVSPVKIDIAGTVESISKITPEILYRCYNTFYNPSNMILCVCGDVTPEDVETVADEMLIEKPPVEIIREQINEPREIASSYVEQKSDVAISIYNIGLKFPPEKTPEDKMKASVELGLLSSLLFSPTSDFYSKYYESGLINDKFGAEFEVYRDISHMIINGSGEESEKVYEAVKQELEYRRTNFFTEAEFEIAKKELYACQISMFEGTEQIASSLMSLRMEGMNFLDMADIIVKTTLDDIKTRFNRDFLPQYTALSVVKPLK